MIGEAMRAALLADSTVAGLVDTRIYPEYKRRNDPVYPLCIYKVEDDTSVVANDGATGLASCTFVVAAISTLYTEAGTIATAIRNALDGSRGTFTGVVIQGIFYQDNAGNDDVITDPQTDAVLYYVKELSFQVWYATR